jgi:release factor glutamine methyltransferase
MPEEQYLDYLMGIGEHIGKNRPVQHITGNVYFLGHKLLVNDNVLIPRYETEELVAQVLLLYDEYFASSKTKLVDIGTGSGCIAIAIKKEAPEIEVYATDISHDALAVAKNNALNLNADIKFFEGDLLSPLTGEKFDIIVANPPYIPNSETVDPIIYDHEPHLALFGGDDGLAFHKRILQEASFYLNERFIIAFEHAYDAADRLQEYALKHFPEASVKTLKDMQGKLRMTFVMNI